MQLFSLKEITWALLTAEHDLLDEVALAFRRVGGIALRDHGLEDLELGLARAQCEAFFRLPPGQKERYVHGSADLPHAYSWAVPTSAYNRERLEFYDIGLGEAGPRAGSDAEPTYYPPNLWPAEVPGFRASMLRTYHHMRRCTRIILQVLGAHINGDDQLFQTELRQGWGVLRALYYAGAEPEAGAPVVMPPHADYSCLTVLSASDNASLEVLSGTRWVAPGTRDFLVVGAGEVLKILSNGYYEPLLHRVVGRPSGTARLSMNFFESLPPDGVVAPLAACLAATGSAPLFDRLTTLDYLREKRQRGYNTSGDKLRDQGGVDAAVAAPSA